VEIIDYLVLAIWSFIEAIFFPLPVDLAILIYVKEGLNPYITATIATLFNTLGSYFGYQIGIYLKRKREKKDSFVNKVFNYFENKFKFLRNLIEPINKKLLNKIQSYLGKEDIIYYLYFLSTISPLPQKVFAIVSGYFKLNVFVFLLLTLIGRGSRFFLVAILAYTLPWPYLIALAVLATFFYLLMHYILKKKGFI